METAIVWFRRDLRVEDNSALAAAAEAGFSILPVFIWAPEDEGSWAPGGASRWWLHQALHRLNRKLRENKLHLVLRKGKLLEELDDLVEATGAKAIFWNRRYEPEIIRRDARIKEHFKEQGLKVSSFCSALLFEPWQVATGEGKAYKVFTPFSKAVAKLETPEPVPMPSRIQMAESHLQSMNLEELELLPKIPWTSGIRTFWSADSQLAGDWLDAFLDASLVRYHTRRDIPGELSTSRLSPYLAWGEIGPRQVRAALLRCANGKGKETFDRELLWREFAYHVLYHFPKTPQQPLQSRFNHFPWEPDEGLLKAWQAGQTGYPIVDAGMRQLWQTGWMHNRVRMVVASFLVKHLLQPWQDGARWFWDTLVDADLASNTMGWQWAGGCGADAAPYFRIFNPVLQGEKFDASGHYVRHYLPELHRLPDSFIHQPWKAPSQVLGHAGVELNETYPLPIIELKAGRERALEAWEKLKSSN